MRNNIPYSKIQFEDVIRIFLGKVTTKDAGSQILKYLKTTQKPLVIDSRSWIEKIQDILETRSIVDPKARIMDTKKMIEEIIYPNINRQQRKDLMKQ